MTINAFPIQGTVHNLGKFIKNKRGIDQINFKLKVPMPGRARSQFHLVQCFDDLADEVALGSVAGDRPIREGDELIIKGWLNSWPDRSGRGKTQYRSSLRATKIIRVQAATMPDLGDIEAAIGQTAASE